VKVAGTLHDGSHVLLELNDVSDLPYLRYRVDNYGLNVPVRVGARLSCCCELIYQSRSLLLGYVCLCLLTLWFSSFRFFLTLRWSRKGESTAALLTKLDDAFERGRTNPRTARSKAVIDQVRTRRTTCRGCWWTTTLWNCPEEVHRGMYWSRGCGRLGRCIL